ncbi:pyridoxal phosphate-dependent transferase [Mycena olivaceomarginata]|nr:pyridoxal phosphate-dependent transferase [Mycena olivaceomarginata]
MAAPPNPFYREPDFETLQLHAGQVVDTATNARAVPIYQSTSFVFNSVEHAQRLSGLQEKGNLYSRVSNPTVDVFEKRIAALEGGMAATYNQFKVTFKRYGVDTKFKTKAIYVESISNSDTVLADIAGLAKVAHDHGIPLVVDNTLGMGGYIVRPISLGADIVVHSATKWISGHGTTMAGVIVDSGRFDWRKSDKFPMITSPSAAYGKRAPRRDLLPVGFALQVRIENLRDLGPCLSAQSAWQALQGVETLSLRAQRHCDNALAVAKYLEAHPKVISVTYLGLPLRSRRCAKDAFGGMLTFRVEGGFEQLASHLANLGRDAKTLVIAPFITIQSQLTPQERELTGVTDDTIRYSVGIESGAFKAAYE